MRDRLAWATYLRYRRVYTRRPHSGCCEHDVRSSELPQPEVEFYSPRVLFRGEVAESPGLFFRFPPVFGEGAFTSLSSRKPTVLLLPLIQYRWSQHPQTGLPSLRPDSYQSNWASKQSHPAPKMAPPTF
ncbi:hypothetical protein M8818_001474 [Zalaria obscura]|uniref:Uncharacterized protein n=1 Tax=Zalaria obscura TaxID=2024903 RepID=A0ACC3SJV0_9PEZI